MAVDATQANWIVFDCLMACSFDVVFKRIGRDEKRAVNNYEQ